MGWAIVCRVTPTSVGCHSTLEGDRATLCYSNPIWIVRRIPQESFSQQPFSLHNSFRIAIVDVLLIDKRIKIVKLDLKAILQRACRAIADGRQQG